jgi:hypothetical protein
MDAGKFLFRFLGVFSEEEMYCVPFQKYFRVFSNGCLATNSKHPTVIFGQLFTELYDFFMAQGYILSGEMKQFV